MQDMFNIETWRRVFGESLAKLGANIAEFCPKILATIALLLIGWLVSKVAEFVLLRVLRWLAFDRLAARMRAAEVLTKAGISSEPSRLVSRLLFWMSMLMFVLSGLEVLGFKAVTDTVDRFIAYLPNALAAGLILILALLSGRLARHLIASGAAAVNWAQAERLGAAASSLVLLVGAVLALANLGVDTEILVSVITVLVGAISLTLGVAFALGATPVVTHILAGHFLRRSLPTGGVLEVDGRRGELERVGPTDTLLRDVDGLWSIPNRRMLEEIVRR